MNPHISVIIPVYNAAETLVDQLDAIRRSQRHGPSSEILVVDNRSTDESAQLAREWALQHEIDLRVIDASDRAGEPHARNVGLAAARAELVAYCDADDKVGERWLAAMAHTLERSPYATGPIDMYTLNPPWIADVRGSSVSGRSLLYDAIPYAHGCNMGFRRSELLEIGGFDERYIAGCDLDVAIRLFDAGHELGYADDAVVEYRLRPSLRSTYRQGVFYGRYRVDIHQRIANRGLTDQRMGRRFRRLAWLARKAPHCLFDQTTRARWVWVAGQQVGELRGLASTRIPETSLPALEQRDRT